MILYPFSHGGFKDKIIENILQTDDAFLCDVNG